MANHRTGGRWTLGAVGLATFFGGASAAAQECGPYEVVPLYLEGQPAAGTNELLQTIDRPNIGESGHVMFAGNLTGPTGTADVVYVDDVLIAREGDLIPGLATPARFGNFEFFETGHQINASGDAAFIATLLDVPAGTNRAVFHNTTIIARTGGPVPGIAGRTIQELGFAGITDDGRVGYLADLDGDTDDDSVIVLGGEVIYREGDPVPGRAANFDGNFDELQWNGAGDLLVEANTSLPLGIDMVMLRRRVRGEAVLEDIPLQEGALITTPQGTFQLELFLQFALAEDGTWGMRGNLDTVFPSNDAIIMTGDGFIAQQGDPVDEFSGAVLGNFNGIDFNSAGHVVYLADLSAPAGLPSLVDEGIFLNGCLVITDGINAPGVDGGPIVSDLGFEDLYINDVGQIVFHMSYQMGDGLFMVDVGKKLPCPGDVNQDGAVNFADLTIVLASNGPCPTGERCPADLDGDGSVGFSDLLEVIANWGTCL
ncbi:MAG: choice-of-anchor tandem repeat NxxGxxAF-containing protein [Phycisphaerales bacterium]